jgi:hypothetical protein
MSASNEGSIPAIAGWEEFVESLRTLPARMLAKLPEAQRHDPQVQQEVGRLALEALTSSALGVLAGDPDHPCGVPQIGQVLNVGQPNADTVYRIARISSDGAYRLRGVRGSLRMFNASQSPPSPGEAGFTPGKGLARTSHDFNTLQLDPNGRFDVILSREPPRAHSGDWWPLDAGTNKLLIRMVSADWQRERSPTLSIERVDIPVTRPRPAGAGLEARLRSLPVATEFIALLFVDRVETLRREGYINALKVVDMSGIGGLTGQFYYEGTYDLADSEALIIESNVPNQCRYRSLILTNSLYETIDWYNNHSSLNDAQSHPDADGLLRFVVCGKDPGVPNWLDTAGHSRGLIQGRWFDVDSRPLPTLRKVSLAQLRSHLPPDTPTVSADAREQLIRERRRALQERPLW